MNKKKLGKTSRTTKNRKHQEQKYSLPSWVPKSVLSEEELCPECFKVVGERKRYNIVCILGKETKGMTVNELTEKIKLQQPTVSHHLQVLQTVDAVKVKPRGRERVYKLNRNAHCFEECKIPY